MARREFGRPLATVVACLYLPFSWLLFVDASPGYRLHWLKLWPILPGLLPGSIFHPRDEVEFAVMGAATLALIVVLTRIGSRGRASLALAAGAALLVSLPTALFAYAVFRS